MTWPFIILRPDDSGRASTLHKMCFEDGWSEASLRDLFADSSVFSLGIEQAGQLVAFVMGQTVTGETDILTIATDLQRRREGLANSLLEAFIHRLQERGVSRVMLDVAEDNHAARQLYRGHGFLEDGRRPRYYTVGRDIPVDAILMSRSLGLAKT